MSTFRESFNVSMGQTRLNPKMKLKEPNVSSQRQYSSRPKAIVIDQLEVPNKPKIEDIIPGGNS